MSTTTSSGTITRRQALGTLGTAAATLAAAPRRARAQAKAPIKLTFWTWENPQQLSLIHI